MLNIFAPKRLLSPILRTLLGAALLSASASQAAGPAVPPSDTLAAECTGVESMLACVAGRTDFTRICWNGDTHGSGTCNGRPVANTSANARGPAITDWACTRDNVTGLIWSLESGVGDWTTYARTTLPNATNAVSRCGYSSGWRLPTRRELLSITRAGNGYPSIDTNYFPGTQVDIYWTDARYVLDQDAAWLVNFYHGDVAVGNTAYTNHVRLVRSGR